ncbi:hypothetical protein BV898_19180 [Hypsibius exemplaris]|uniref:Uncharacterized protein n=1 Tax=Hypsibius exemplaris TaxID=2072580 RepID=A0A9X6RPH7_HYPEX|nr:hypothetical protein BV898_19180 [Hypsibius exemplaris]
MGRCPAVTLRDTGRKESSESSEKRQPWWMRNEPADDAFLSARPPCTPTPSFVGQFPTGVWRIESPQISRAPLQRIMARKFHAAKKKNNLTSSPVSNLDAATFQASPLSQLDTSPQPARRSFTFRARSSASPCILISIPSCPGLRQGVYFEKILKGSERVPLAGATSSCSMVSAASVVRHGGSSSDKHPQRLRHLLRHRFSAIGVGLRVQLRDPLVSSAIGSKLVIISIFMYGYVRKLSTGAQKRNQRPSTTPDRVISREGS